MELVPSRRRESQFHVAVTSLGKDSLRLQGWIRIGVMTGRLRFFLGHTGTAPPLCLKDSGANALIG